MKVLPHIRKGTAISDLWRCESCEPFGGKMANIVGVGDTPKDAYDDWKTERAVLAARVLASRTTRPQHGAVRGGQFNYG